MVKCSRKDQHFYSVLRRFEISTPKTYRKIGFEVCRLVFGPEIPDKAFDNLDTLREWYRAVLHAWLGDSLSVADLWHGRLPSQENELALNQLVLEAMNNGVRRIQRRLLRDRDGVPRELPIGSYSELGQWCDFMFEVLNDDDQHVAQERARLTVRYDKGVAYRLEEERKELLAQQDKWVAEMTHSFMKALSKGEPKTLEPDDDWLLVIWGSLAGKESVREAAVSLFIDATEQPKQPHTRLLDDIISGTWKAMRELGPVCRDEPTVNNAKQVRKHLDTVKRFCARQEPKARIRFRSKVEAMDQSADGQRDFDAFVVSAKGETSTKNFQDWAGGEQVTLAIVFTDVVGSTALGEEIRDEAMDEVRRAHFAQSRRLIGQFQGREIKTIGDSFMAAFKSANAALDYARALQGNTGHPQVRIRAGIHIGPMRVEKGDVFGGTVNFAARVVGAIRDAEIWLSERAKEDIDRQGAAKHKGLNWEGHEGVSMKGFRGGCTLWALKN
jgi:class 3 adenylate cyclase